MTFHPAKETKEERENRKIRGYAIIGKGETPETVNDHTWYVSSQSNTKNKYKVMKGTSGWLCACPDYQNRALPCKHIYSIQFWLNMKEKLEKNESIEIDNVTDKEICPFCKSESIVKNGLRITTTEKRQRYKCISCSKRFTLNPIKHVKVNAKILSLTLDLYFKGLSLRDISDTIYQFYSIRIHFDTIRRWIMKYTEMMDKFTEKFKPEVGEKWHFDEQMIKVRGNWMYSWNSIDAKTRFLLANHLSKGREESDAMVIAKRSKQEADKIPMEVNSDGLQSYNTPFRKVFNSRRNYLEDKAKHIRNCGVAKKDNNNMIERYHNEFREFDKTRRGFKRINTTKKWNKAYRLYHNFIRQNMALRGLTPAQVSNIDLELGRNRWEGLLRLSLKDK